MHEIWDYNVQNQDYWPFTKTLNAILFCMLWILAITCVAFCVITMAAIYCHISDYIRHSCDGVSFRGVSTVLAIDRCIVMQFIHMRYNCMAPASPKVLLSNILYHMRFNSHVWSVDGDFYNKLSTDQYKLILFVNLPSFKKKIRTESCKNVA